LNNLNVYILSIEASQIHSHMHRGQYIKRNYVGMIPYSLELLKLHKEQLHTFPSNRNPDKILSNDIINVKFKQKVKTANQTIKDLKKKINNLGLDMDERPQLERKIEYKQKLEKYIDYIEANKHKAEWQVEVSNEDLRKYLYANGFTITNADGTQDRYVVYKRSSAKSRTGQCLMIKEHLYSEMINWSRMHLPFEKDMKIDYASLLAYESLVGSSIEDTIEINANNILIVSDVESKFTETANVIRKGEDGYLDSFTEDVEISNSLFDGESLLDNKYFADGQSMKLLRNHMFKSAAFNTNIQEFMKDHCPDGIDYSKWKITDMFGNTILAKNIHMITTPSSLKALKFSHVIGTDSDMWDYWKRIVTDEGHIFGVCKHEKESKRGHDEDGHILQQTSYQMLNSMPMNKADIEKLVTFEKNYYIERLKNDDDFFIEHVKESANSVNSNEMFADLYERNKDIVNTKVFREFRKQQVKDHVDHVKKGKIRLNGDYCVMLGNPVEFLYHAIGKCDIALTENQIYTTLFEFDKELVGFRNPHTSPSNVLIAKNTDNEQIKKYFNLTENIVCVNAIKFPLQDILSGSDYDSDTLLLLDNEHLKEISDKCFGKYRVCINQVESQKKEYILNNNDMCEIDNQLATSQKNIGSVVNLGQLCMSTYWDLLSKGKTEEELSGLLKKIDIMTVLSGICIDLCKKFYDIEIDKEIENVEKTPELSKLKPMFWVNVSQSKTIKNRVDWYNCPMDHLQSVMSKLDKADYKTNVELSNLLDKKDARNGNRKQKTKIKGLIVDMQDEINSINAKYVGNEDYIKDERFNLTDDVMSEYLSKVCKLKVKTDTMFDILDRIEHEYCEIGVRLMNALYRTQPEAFLDAFKQK
jgi:hypothetical protein